MKLYDVEQSAQTLHDSGGRKSSDDDDTPAFDKTDFGRRSGGESRKFRGFNRS